MHKTMLLAAARRLATTSPAIAEAHNGTYLASLACDCIEDGLYRHAYDYLKMVCERTHDSVGATSMMALYYTLVEPHLLKLAYEGGRFECGQNEPGVPCPACPPIQYRTWIMITDLVSEYHAKCILDRLTASWRAGYESIRARVEWTPVQTAPALIWTSVQS